MIGGIAKKDQVEALKGGRPEVVIATPGRLCDLISSGKVSLLRFCVEEGPQTFRIQSGRSLARTCLPDRPTA